MKGVSHQQRSARGVPARGEQAMTLPELMIAVSIFSMVVLALVYTQMFGMRYDQLVNSKSGASDNSRMGFDKLTLDVRSAKIWRVGTGSFTGFTPCANATAQQGNALQLSLNDNTNVFIRYWFDSSLGQLCRWHSTDAASTMIATNLLNTNIAGKAFFTAEDCAGAVVHTNVVQRYVVHAIMQFYEFQYPLTKVGPDYLYDCYKLEFKVTPHCPD